LLVVGLLVPVPEWAPPPLAEPPRTTAGSDPTVMCSTGTYCPGACLLSCGDVEANPGPEPPQLGGGGKGKRNGKGPAGRQGAGRGTGGWSHERTRPFSRSLSMRFVHTSGCSRCATPSPPHSRCALPPLLDEGGWRLRPARGCGCGRATLRANPPFSLLGRTAAKAGGEGDGYRCVALGDRGLVGRSTDAWQLLEPARLGAEIPVRRSDADAEPDSEVCAFLQDYRGSSPAPAVAAGEGHMWARRVLLTPAGGGGFTWRLRASRQ